jgi:hypothetical protein
MSIESLPSPGFIERAATTLEQTLARVVAHFRAEVASDKRAVEAEYRAAVAELAIVTERSNMRIRNRSMVCHAGTPHRNARRRWRTWN